MAKKRGKTQADLFDEAWAAVDARLAEGDIPWHRPWTCLEPTSLSTGKVYNGFNWLLLSCAPFAGHRWGTFNQVSKLRREHLIAEGHDLEERKRKRGRGTYWWDLTTDSLVRAVEEGQKAWPIFVWKRWSKVEEDPRTGEEVRKGGVFLRGFKVFNEDQCLPLGLPEITAPPVPDGFDLEALDSIFGLPGLRIDHGGSVAAYNPRADRVILPVRDVFKSVAEYYATRGHEVGHATGHESRIGRDLSGIFGDHRYSFEELVADITATFLCAHAGIDSTRTIENTAAYIAHWRRKLADDHGALLRAATQARKAALYIIHNGHPPAHEEGDDGAAEAA